MAPVIAYLDAHAGAIQALTALVLVGVTTWYALLTRTLAKSAVKARRPYVYVDISGEGGARLELVVGNDGSNAAQDITFQLTTQGSAYVDSQIRLLGMLESGVSYLAPGRQYRYAIQLEDLSIFDAPPGQHVVLSLSLTYRDGKEIYADTFRMDLSALKGVLVSSFSNPEAAIARELRSISRTLESDSRRAKMPLRFSARCPICGEPIGAGVRKCPHCLEWLGNPRRISRSAPSGRVVRRRPRRPHS